ncbi:MAG TPA: VCBS repeat-containing protein [Ornithinibacter sp.]|nr:VCBS repeat-containing protein [Ornithinibacter sp.]
MTLLPTTGRSRAVLVATVTGALVAGVVGTTPALGASTDDPRAEILSGFAQQTREGSSAASPLAVQKDGPAVREQTKAPQSPSRTEGEVAASPQRAAAAAAAADCAGLELLVTQTQDHGHVSWAALPGATSFTVLRERAGASATTIATLPGTSTSLEDTGQNTLGQVAYTVRATVDGSTLSCRTPEVDYWSMSTLDGVGYPDIFFAGTDQVWEQDTYGPAFPSYTAEAFRPAFSPNGRLVAAVEKVADVWTITVRKASTGVVQWSVASPSGTMLDEPAFSPDGQRIVAEALALPGLDVSNGLYTVPVNTTTHPLTLVPGSSGLVTADWVDTPGALASTTIVAANLAPGGLMTLVNATTGARTPILGTEGALDPMGRADGSILFTTRSDTSATLDERLADGSLHRIQTWADSTARWPVTDPDTGGVLVYLDEPDTENPGSRVWSVSAVDPDTGLTEVTGIGLPRSNTAVGFQGFDLRTPVSPGTSDFGGASNGDILARSSTGVLYAYPLSASTDRFFDTRQQMGTGWGIMRQFIAIGDLNSDGQGDIAAVDTSGNLWFYPGKGSFGLGGRTKLGTGWSSYAILSTGDFNGDTKADLVARDTGGRLWMYPGNGSGGLSTRVQIGSGWSIFNAIVGPGDWNYDGNPDLLARVRTTGYLYLYPGNGKGGFGARKYLGTGWNARTGFAAPEIWGGVNALFARTPDGVLLDYDSVGNGVVKSTNVYQAGTGWNPFTITG